jgi:hypothetical protein
MNSALALLLLVLGGVMLLATIMALRWIEAQSWRASLVAYQLGLPGDLEPADVAAWLGHIVAGTQAPRLGVVTPPPVALEITATARGIRHVLLVPERMEGAVLGGLRAAMPAVRFGRLDNYWDERPVIQIAAEARLTHLQRPLAHERAEQASAALLASLSPLRPDESVVLQYLFVGVTHTTPATERNSAAEIMATLLGDETRGKDAEALQAAKRKQAEPMLSAVIRLGVASASTRDVDRVIRPCRL